MRGVLYIYVISLNLAHGAVLSILFYSGSGRPIAMVLENQIPPKFKNWDFSNSLVVYILLIAFVKNISAGMDKRNSEILIVRIKNFHSLSFFLTPGVPSCAPIKTNYTIIIQTHIKGIIPPPYHLPTRPPAAPHPSPFTAPQ